MHNVLVLIVYDIGNSIHYVILHPYELHIIFNQKKKIAVSVKLRCSISLNY